MTRRQLARHPEFDGYARARDLPEQASGIPAPVDTNEPLDPNEEPERKPRYMPPTDPDAPLDLVERAIVSALVPVIVARIRAEAASKVESSEQRCPTS